MKRSIFLTVIVLAVIALLLSPCPVAAKGKKFEGTWCRAWGESVDGPDLPFGWEAIHSGTQSYNVASSDERVEGQFYAYSLTVAKVEYDEDVGSEAFVQANFILEPTAYAERGTWYGQFECIYTVEDGIRYHTITLHGRGTGDLAGLAISMNLKHEVQGKLKCSANTPWPFNGKISKVKKARVYDDNDDQQSHSRNCRF